MNSVYPRGMSQDADLIERTGKATARPSRSSTGASRARCSRWRSASSATRARRGRDPGDVRGRLALRQSYRPSAAPRPRGSTQSRGTRSSTARASASSPRPRRPRSSPARRGRRSWPSLVALVERPRRARAASRAGARRARARLLERALPGRGGVLPGCSAWNREDADARRPRAACGAPRRGEGVTTTTTSRPARRTHRRGLPDELRAELERVDALLRTVSALPELPPAPARGRAACRRQRPRRFTFRRAAFGLATVAVGGCRVLRARLLDRRRGVRRAGGRPDGGDRRTPRAPRRRSASAR